MRIFWMAIAMLLIRIGFDLIILPTRQMKSEEVLAKKTALDLAEKTKGETLYCYFNPEFEPHHYYCRNLVLFRYQYWLSVGRGDIVYATSEKIPGALYFSEENHIMDFSVKKVGEVVQPLSPKKKMPLFRFE
jgi:hypothetical protein